LEKSFPSFLWSEMYFVALATDYDGTLAEDGLVAEETIAALRSFKHSGRKLILVTGRELPDLRRVFSHLDLFDLAVVENGALLVDPATGEELPLGDEPPAPFVEELRRRNVTPLSVGRSIVATWEPNEKTVLEVIRNLGLELQIVFNKGAVMVLPAGVNKASGLAAALARLQLSRSMSWESATRKTTMPFSARAGAPWPSPTHCRRSRRTPRSSRARRAAPGSSRLYAGSSKPTLARSPRR
jgi:haloacid dehalogenase-like hydrolase